MREGNAPADEVFRNLRQIVQLAPAAQQEHPAHGDAGKQGREPREVAGNPLRPANQPIRQHPHVSLLLKVSMAA